MERKRLGLPLLYRRRPIHDEILNDCCDDLQE
jgi:hypothetical protein